MKFTVFSMGINWYWFSTVNKELSPLPSWHWELLEDYSRLQTKSRTSLHFLGADYVNLIKVKIALFISSNIKLAGDKPDFFCFQEKSKKRNRKKIGLLPGQIFNKELKPKSLFKKLETPIVPTSKVAEKKAG